MRSWQACPARAVPTKIVTNAAAMRSPPSSVPECMTRPAQLWPSRCWLARAGQSPPVRLATSPSPPGSPVRSDSPASKKTPSRWPPWKSLSTGRQPHGSTPCGTRTAWPSSRNYYPLSGARHDPLLRRPVCAAGQPARPQVGRFIGLPASDREYPIMTVRSGMQRARGCLVEHLIRRSGHIVQDRPLPVVGWADIPELSAQDRHCPAAWQQCWQQSRWNGTDRRPSFQA